LASVMATRTTRRLDVDRAGVLIRGVIV
jgi:hypothetical protein